MKYIYYIFVFLTVVIRRLVFLFVFLSMPFRAKLNNIVFNYHLQNDIPLKRLLERHPVIYGDGWELNNEHGPIKGYIKRTKVNKFKYYIALIFWLLLDSDAMADTYDAGFNETIVEGKRKKWMPKFIKRYLKNDIEKNKECKAIGNTFDLGDKRAECPLYGFWSVLFWTLRNPAYNFNYKFNQKQEGSYGGEFSFTIGNRFFGWHEDGVINGKKYYSWEFARKV